MVSTRHGKKATRQVIQYSCELYGKADESLLTDSAEEDSEPPASGLNLEEGTACFKTAPLPFLATRRPCRCVQARTRPAESIAHRSPSAARTAHRSSVV